MAPASTTDRTVARRHAEVAERRRPRPSTDGRRCRTPSRARPERRRHHAQRPPGDGTQGRADHRRRRAPRRVHPALLLAQPDELGRHVPHVPRRGRQRPRSADHALVHVHRRPGHEDRHRVADDQAASRRASSSCCSPTTRSTARSATRAASARCRTRRTATGPGESRYVEEKRHFEKPIPISDLVLLDRERCILCDRCTRFADEVAGDALISFTQRGNSTQVLTFPDEPFASYFSGNTVQICPVGALTATPYRFKARPWDLEQVESTCTTCSVGCRTVVQSSRDELVRYLGVDSDPVNWGWLCDRGRFNFEAVNSDDRLGAPLVRGEGGSRPGVVGRRHDRRRPTRDRGARRRRTGQHRRARRGARHERGRLRVGRAGRRPRHPAPRRPARRRAAGRAAAAAPGDDRRGGRRHPPSCCSAPTSRRSCRSSISGCATPPSSARRSSSSSGRWPRGSRRTPGAACASRPALSAPCRQPSPTTRSPTSCAPARSSSSPAAPTSPSRPAPQRPACAPCSTPARTPRCCRHCGAATSSVRCSSASPRATTASTAPGILVAAAEGRVDLLVLLGADPIADCPDADLARRAIAGARRVHRRRHVPHRVLRRRRRRARRRRVRREVGHDDEPRGPGHRGRPEGLRRRDLAPGLDDRRRARRAARSRRRRPGARVGRGDHRRHRRRRPGLRRRHPRRAAGDARRCARRAGRRRGGVPRADPPRRPTGSATTTAWC